MSKLMVHGVFVFDIVNSCNISSGSFFTRYVRIFVGHVHHSDKSLIHIYPVGVVKRKQKLLLLMLSGLCEIIFFGCRQESGITQRYMWFAKYLDSNDMISPEV